MGEKLDGKTSLLVLMPNSHHCGVSHRVVALLQVEGQLLFFAQQLMPHSQASSEACLAAASAAHSSSAAPGGSDAAHHVTVSMLRSYKIPSTLAGRLQHCCPL